MALNDVAIAGVHVTRQARDLPGVSSMDVVIEAVRGALDDAGLERHDVDGACIEWPGPGGSPAEPSSNWAPFFGGSLAWTSDEITDMGASVRGVLKAAAAIATGQCEVVVLGSGRASRSVIGGGQATEGAALGTTLGLEFADPYGVYNAPEFALVAARHMHDYGTTSAQIAMVAATVRNNGHMNPEACYYGRGPFTVDDVMQSRMVASPLHLLDMATMNCGGNAIVLTSIGRARQLRKPPVVILGGRREHLRGAYANPALLREVGAMGRAAARIVLGRAGVSAHDLDVLSLYDPNAFEIMRCLEMLELCEPGGSGPYVESGAIALDGAHPVNTDGGLLSHGWNGLGQMGLKVIEGVRQLRREACNQIHGAELAFVTNAGAGAQHVELLLLGTDR